MKELTAEELIRLTQEVGAPRLSLFLPLSPGSARSTKIRVRAKNALLRADRALRAEGSRGPEGAQILGRVQVALDRVRPRGPNHQGLALFADPERVRLYHVPFRVPELAVVGERFTVAPLLPLLNAPGEFYELGLDVTGRPLAAWASMPR